MVSPIKAPSSAGRSAARKSESADAPAAPGRPEFAASLQGVFALVDAAPQVRQAPEPVREDGSSAPEGDPFRGAPGRQPHPGVPAGHDDAPAGEAADESPDAGAPPIARALGALDELRLREGLKPAPEAPVPAAPATGAAEEILPSTGGPASGEPALPPAPLPALPEIPKAEPGAPAPALEATPVPEPSPVPDAGRVEPGAAVKAPALPAVAAVQVLASESADEPPPAPEGDAVQVPAGAAPLSGAEVRSGSPAAARGAGPATPAETVDRIVQAAQLLKSRGATRLRLRLDPPSLGGLKVDLTVRKGVLEGRLTAESVQSRDLLAAQMDRLKEQLASQGLNVGEFQVGVDQSFQQASGDPSWTGRGAGRGKGGTTGEAESSAEDEAPGRVPRGPQIIDVRI